MSIITEQNFWGLYNRVSNLTYVIRDAIDGSVTQVTLVATMNFNCITSMKISAIFIARPKKYNIQDIAQFKIDHIYLSKTSNTDLKLLLNLFEYAYEYDQSNFKITKKNFGLKLQKLSKLTYTTTIDQYNGDSYAIYQLTIKCIKFNIASTWVEVKDITWGSENIPIQIYKITDIDQFKIDHMRIFSDKSDNFRMFQSLYEYAASKWYRRCNFIILVENFKKISSIEPIAKVLNIYVCAVHIASYI
jgi:hypothetical protein